MSIGSVNAHGDPAAVELEHELDQVAEAAGEPVELPYDQRVTRSEAVQALIELWAVLERPGADVLEDPLDAGAAQRVELQRDVLIGCRHSGVRRPRCSSPETLSKPSDGSPPPAEVSGQRFERAAAVGGTGVGLSIA